MKEWKKYKLGEILTVKYGKDHKKLDAGSIPVYGSGGLMRFVNSYICDSPSILIPRKGSLNNVMYVEHPFWTVDTMFWTIIDTTIAVPRFVYYAICKIDFESLNVGSAVPSMTVPIIEDIEIFLPSLDEQKRIVKVLSSLESKIELNRQINDNLEQQAKALYKSWFVDFEPFKEGKFIESELGVIPEGWSIGKIEDLTTRMASGGTPKSMNPDFYSGDICWFTTKELTDGFLIDSEKHISQSAIENSAAKVFPKGSVLMAIYAAPTVGRLGILSCDAAFNQAAVALIPKTGIGPGYIYLTLYNERNNFNNLSSGAAQQNLNVGLVRNYPTCIPPQDVLADFENKILPIFNNIERNQIEISTLTTLRDTLLPKLMSGELKINEIDC